MLPVTRLHETTTIGGAVKICPLLFDGDTVDLCQKTAETLDTGWYVFYRLAHDNSPFGMFHWDGELFTNALGHKYEYEHIVSLFKKYHWKKILEDVTETFC